MDDEPPSLIHTTALRVRGETAATPRTFDAGAMAWYYRLVAVVFLSAQESRREGVPHHTSLMVAVLFAIGFVTGLVR